MKRTIAALLSLLMLLAPTMAPAQSMQFSPGPVSVTGKANLTGGNTWTGDQTLTTGNVTLSGGDVTAQNVNVNNALNINSGLAIWLKDGSATTRGKISGNGSGFMALDSDSTKIRDFAGATTFGTITSASVAWTIPVNSTGSFLSSGATSGVGYATGAGGAVTQITSRTTGVTNNKACGAITMFSAAGSATWASFTVTDSAVAATDVIVANVKSATNLYLLSVTTVSAGSFVLSYATTGGTATDAPVINYCVIKGVSS